MSPGRNAHAVASKILRQAKFLGWQAGAPAIFMLLAKSLSLDQLTEPE